MNNKPTWDDAPEWAQWLAQDESGCWWFYEEQPHQVDGCIWDSKSVRSKSEPVCRSGLYNHNWQSTLEPRITNPEHEPMTEEEEELVPSEPEPKRSKYHVEIKPGIWVDVYDVLTAYNVTNPADAHAIKKMLMPGQRGAKDAEQDREEAIASLVRAGELEVER